MISHESHKEIHRKLKKHSPEGVRRAKKFFALKYPKLILFIVLIGVSYYLFSRPFMEGLLMSMREYGNASVFVCGLLTSFGFTTPLGIGFLINLTPADIFIAALLGAIGAVIADLIIFKSVKFTFSDEIKRLERTKIIRQIENIVKKDKHVLIRHYLMYVFAGIMFLTPLPDEFGVSMLAGLTTIKPLKLAIISFITHTAMIYFILAI